MNRKELKLLKHTLKEAIQADDGSSHWLPEQYLSDLRACLKLVKRELKKAKPPAPETNFIHGKNMSIIRNADGTCTTIYDDDDLQ